MNSPLTAILLGESPVRTAPSRPVAARPAARVATPVRGLRPVSTPPLRERRIGLRRTLSEAVAARDTVVLTYQEARAVLRMFEELEADPFIPSDGKIDQQDLGNLGIDTDVTGGSGPGTTQRAPATNDANANLLSPSLAVMAPEATPNEDDAPPPEIADALQAFDDGPEEDPAVAGLKNDRGEYDLDSVLALARGKGVPENDGALPSVRRERGAAPAAPVVQESAPEPTPETGGWMDALSNLKQGRRIVETTKREKAQAARAKKGIA